MAVAAAPRRRSSRPGHTSKAQGVRPQRLIGGRNGASNRIGAARTLRAQKQLIRPVTDASATRHQRFAWTPDKASNAILKAKSEGPAVLGANLSAALSRGRALYSPHSQTTRPSANEDNESHSLIKQPSRTKYTKQATDRLPTGTQPRLHAPRPGLGILVQATPSPPSPH
jgi:hypothetical protein